MCSVCTVYVCSSHVRVVNGSGSNGQSSEAKESIAHNYIDHRVQCIQLKIRGLVHTEARAYCTS